MPQSKTAELYPATHKLAPHLICAGAADAIAFYKRAFGAEEIFASRPATRFSTPR